MRYFVVLAIFIATPGIGQRAQWTPTDAPKDASFRGVSVVDDNIAWISGSNGWTGRTTDGGKTWTFKQIKDFEKWDFRTLYAFDKNVAIAANAGAPAYIVRTVDGGITWKVVYQNDHKDAFLDGTDFWDEKEGIVYGDPIEGKMLLLRTADGGNTWHELTEQNKPQLEKGEASFAASGTGIECLPGNKVVIATGGKVSRLWISHDKGIHWRFLTPPVLQGGVMTGIYSVAFEDIFTGVVVGGDYERDTLKSGHVFYTRNGGRTWKAPQTPTRGIRECVEYISPATLIATGFSGVDISYDGGVTWKALSDERDFHVIRKARKGSLIIAAGAKGKLAQLTLIR